MKDKTIVVFLKNDGHIYAYFPNEASDLNGNKTSYAHIGQHSGCSPEYAKESIVCSNNEYEDLLKELVSGGYDDLWIVNTEENLRAGQTYEYALEELPF